MAMPAHQRDQDEAEIGGQVAFTPEAYAQVAALAAAKGMTVPEYVRAAIGLTQWIDDVFADGGTLLVRHKHQPWEVLRAPRSR